MNFRNALLIIAVLILPTSSAPATVYYVDVNSTGQLPPYTNWATAATVIQDAVDTAISGDLILVTNGNYKVGGRAVYGAATNRVTVDRAVTVQSVNGPDSTAIEGDGGAMWPGSIPSGIRCVYLTNGATLIGFTLTNGASRGTGDLTNEQSGGGIWCEAGSVTISNCVLTRNFANRLGGGVFRGTLNSCLLVSNTAYYSGGGAYGSILQNCTINSNSTVRDFVGPGGAIGGGGACSSTLQNCTINANRVGSTGGDAPGGSTGGGALSSFLQNCTVSSNSAGYGGGVMYGVVNNSIIISNQAFSGGGAYGATLNNCVLEYNGANYGGGAVLGGDGTLLGSMTDCTVVYNVANFLTNFGPGIGGGIVGGVFTNCIIYYNVNQLYVNQLSGDYTSNYNGGAFNYCCTAPLPRFGTRNITNEPLFVINSNLFGDFHLQSNSPCINSGNNSAITNNTDLDGNPRIVGGTVDIGAYEFQTPTSVLSYAWLQQYGLPADGSADYADPDGDGMNNWQEWHTGTNPNDASSLLKMLSPSNNVSGLNVTWQSVSGITYFLDRSSNLGSQPAFSNIQSSIVGQAGTTTYTDVTATNGGPYFYRVGVQ